MPLECPQCDFPIPDAIVVSEAGRINGSKKPGSGRPPRLVTYQGRQQTVRAFYAELGINRQQLYRRMKKEAANERH